MPSASLDSPFGPLTITEEDGEITALGWHGGQSDHTPVLDAASQPNWPNTSPGHGPISTCRCGSAPG